uniref:Uncharacterized protein n=1 Tax=Caenorhabditis japonica TaxID=281687 RepID=A0A8R1E4L5_CAEJA
MTIECCECIGCHQGMRFGKRSQAFSTPELEEIAIARNNEQQDLEEAIAAIELELLANRIALRGGGLFANKFNH